jgi:hypothetical protein
VVGGCAVGVLVFECGAGEKQPASSPNEGRLVQAGRRNSGRATLSPGMGEPLDERSSRARSPRLGLILRRLLRRVQPTLVPRMG